MQGKPCMDFILINLHGTAHMKAIKLAYSMVVSYESPPGQWVSLTHTHTPKERDTHTHKSQQRKNFDTSMSSHFFSIIYYSSKLAEAIRTVREREKGRELCTFGWLLRNFYLKLGSAVLDQANFAISLHLSLQNRPWAKETFHFFSLLVRC